MQFQSKLVSDGVSIFEPAVSSLRNMCCAARLSGSQAGPAPVRQSAEAAAHQISETEILRRKVLS